MSQTEELKSRITAKRKQLEADLAKAKADAKGTSNDASQEIQKKLEELQTYIGDGWDNLSENVASQLNDWLK